MDRGREVEAEARTERRQKSRNHNGDNETEVRAQREMRMNWKRSLGLKGLIQSIHLNINIIHLNEAKSQLQHMAHTGSMQKKRANSEY